MISKHDGQLEDNLRAIYQILLAKVAFFFFRNDNQSTDNHRKNLISKYVNRSLISIISLFLWS